jgi:hypothetical protein
MHGKGENFYFCSFLYHFLLGGGKNMSHFPFPMASGSSWPTHAYTYGIPAPLVHVGKFFHSNLTKKWFAV